MGKKRGSTVALDSVFRWVRKQSPKLQSVIAAAISISTIVGLHYFMDTDYFYVGSEIVYWIGTLVLVYKLTKHKNCSGLSLRSQEATALFLAGRLLCANKSPSDADFHALMTFLSLGSTCWVIYMMRYKLHSTYNKELDSMPLYYLVVPCVVLSLIINPGYPRAWALWSLLWAFSTYMESVSGLPQLRLIQNEKVVEPFTAHYVFALGIARFFGFSHWTLLIYETGGKSLLMMATDWYFWLFTNMLAEIVQTFILADFCYYYIKSVMRGPANGATLPCVIKLPVHA